MTFDLGSDMALRVRARYDEPHRAYHTWTHVLACLEARKAIAETVSPEVDLALLFHDAIYDPLAHDNEEKSAELLREEGRRAGIDDEVLERAAELVLATKHGAVVASSPDACVVVDADLSILGADRETFDAYEIAVRREYAMVPADAFRAGRAKVLQQFLDRPIFETPRGRDLWEARARANLERSLAALRSG